MEANSPLPNCKCSLVLSAWGNNLAPFVLLTAPYSSTGKQLPKKIKYKSQQHLSGTPSHFSFLPLFITFLASLRQCKSSLSQEELLKLYLWLTESKALLL